jgi:hypothetical protein
MRPESRKRRLKRRLAMQPKGQKSNGVRTLLMH